MSRTKQAPSRKSSSQFPIQGIYQLGPADTEHELPPRHGIHMYTSSAPPYLLCVSSNKLLVIDTIDRELYAEYETAGDTFLCVTEYSGLILLGSSLGRLYPISLADFQCSPPMQVHEGPVVQLLVHPEESSWVASIAEDGYLRLSDMRTDKGRFKRVQDRFLLQLKISGKLRAIAFSPRGDWLLTGYENGVRAWEVDRNNLSKEKRSRKTGPPFSVQLAGSQLHHSAVERLVFVRDDVVASKEETESYILLWKFDIDAEVWRLSSEMIEHEPTLLFRVACDFSAFDFMPRTCSLVTAMKGGVIRILPLLFEEQMERNSDVTITVRLGGAHDLAGPDQPITGLSCINNKIIVGLANNCVALWN